MFSATNCFKLNYCGFLPALQGSSDRTSITQRFNLYWRDSVMLTGLVTAVVGVVAALFQGALLLGIFLTVSACVIGFGSYYVSRYAELQEMKKQLSDLKNINTNLDTQLTTFFEHNGVLESSVSNLKESLERRSFELGETSRQFESFKCTHEDLARANAHLQMLLATLSSLTLDLEKAQSKINLANTTAAGLHTNIEVETLHLQKIRNQISLEVLKLERISTILEERAAEFPNLASVVEALKQLSASSLLAQNGQITQ